MEIVRYLAPYYNAKLFTTKRSNNKLLKALFV